MIRRRFLATLTALLPAAFWRAPAVDKVGSEKDRHGNCVADAYLRMPDGQYRKVPRHTLKSGDHFIMLGLDGDRLWRASFFVVGEKGSYLDKDGTWTVEFIDSKELI